MHVWTRNLSSVNSLLQKQVRIGLDAAGGPNRGHASRKIKAGKADSHLVKDRVACGIEHVVVHSHQSWNDAVTMQIENLGAGWNSARSVSHGGNFPAAHNNRLIFACRRARAVNHPNMGERDGRPTDLHESLNFLR